MYVCLNVCMHVFECPVCIYACMSEKVLDPITDECEVLCDFWELNSWALEELQGL